MSSVLVLAAFPPELSGLGLPLERATRVAGRSVYLQTVGVGPLASASGTALALAREPVTATIFVGTAGVFPAAVEWFPIGSAVCAKSTTLVDVSVLRGKAQRPELQRDTFELAGELRRELGAPEATVATTTAITVDDEWALELGGASFDLEHLELAGVAAACAAVDVPFAAVLGISNVVGATGRSEWLANHEAAARAATEVVKAWLVR